MTLSSDRHPAQIGDAGSVVEVLKDAKRVIEKGWTQNIFSSDGYNETNIDDKHAVEFCLIGAIRSVSPTIKIAHRAEIRLSDAIGIDWHELETWNDKWYRTKKSVIKALDKAIYYVNNITCPRESSLVPPMLRSSVTGENRHGVTALRDAIWMMPGPIAPERRGRARVSSEKNNSRSLSVRPLEGCPRSRARTLEA